MTDNTKDQSLLTKLLIRVPGVARIKVLKDLFLLKLDDSLFKLDDLLENDSAQITSTIRLIEAIEYLTKNIDLCFQENSHTTFNIAKVQEQNANLFQLISDIQEQYSSFYNEVKESQAEISEFQTEISKEISDLQKQYNSFQTEVIESQQKITASLTKIEDDSNRTFFVVSRSPNLDPEIRLMVYLYSFLPYQAAIDIGANKGDVSNELLKSGYEVYAFEPFPETFRKLTQRFQGVEDFHGFQFALGAVDEVKELFIAQDQSPDHRYKDSTLYNSLINHSMPDDLVFTDSIAVPVRSLESLHKSKEIPQNIGLVKIDTEGYDLEVLKGMGDYQYPVIVTEFWDQDFPFGVTKTSNYLSDMVSEMKERGYHWYLTIYRVWGSDEVSFYCNIPETIERSWGNVFYFREHDIFTQAMTWCSSVLKTTYFR